MTLTLNTAQREIGQVLDIKVVMVDSTRCLWPDYHIYTVNFLQNCALTGTLVCSEGHVSLSLGLDHHHVGLIRYQLSLRNSALVG